MIDKITNEYESQRDHSNHRSNGQYRFLNRSQSVKRELQNDPHERDVEKLNKLKSELSAGNPNTVIGTNDCEKDVSWEADVIIIAGAYEAEKEIAEKISDFAIGKIVISISNPLNTNYSDLVNPRNTSAGEELQRLLSYSKVVKVFNTTFPSELNSSAHEASKADAFIAANNGHALEVVSSIITAAGFNPVVAGDLSVCRSLERMLLKQIQISLRSRYAWLAGWKILHN
jgi:8-hydroxy-5-deazaflavin:NADPH oxidoreductase